MKGSEPAFPAINYDRRGNPIPYSGMTLRQWYVGQAMVAWPQQPVDLKDDEAFAKWCCHMADLVLETERKG